MDSDLINERPEEARRQLRVSFREAGALLAGAAGIQGVHASTFSRWVTRLGLVEEFRTTRARAKAEGWAAPDGRGSGKRGPDRNGSKSGATRAKSARRRWRTTRKQARK